MVNVSILCGSAAARDCLSAPALRIAAEKCTVPLGPRQADLVVFERIAESLRLESHPSWVLLQQVCVRGLAAAKFLLAAQILGPQSFGVVTVALLSIAVAEALTDTGLQQAVVQHEKPPDESQAGALWTLAMVRGCGVAILLASTAQFTASFFHVPEASPVLLLCAVVPLLRSSISPGVHVRVRERANRKSAIYESIAAAIDFSVTAALLVWGVGPVAIVGGSVVGETAKIVMSWTFMAQPVRPNFQWSKLRQHVSYGKWIWGSSVLALCLNQLDKALIGRLLGPIELGLYQVAAKLAQLAVADGAIALGNYLFPTFSELNRKSRSEADDFLARSSRRYLPVFAGVTAVLVFFADRVVQLAFGSAWSRAVPILQVMAICMLLGAAIAILVAFVRAIGRPQAVVAASAIQLVSLAALAPFLIAHWGPRGMAVALACSLAVSASILYGAAQRPRR